MIRELFKSEISVVSGGASFTGIVTFLGITAGMLSLMKLSFEYFTGRNFNEIDQCHRRMMAVFAWAAGSVLAAGVLAEKNQ